jgi:hypothetical protein
MLHLRPAIAIKYVGVLLRAVSIQLGLRYGACENGGRGQCSHCRCLKGLYLTQNSLATCFSAATLHGPVGARWADFCVQHMIWTRAERLLPCAKHPLHSCH